MLQAYLADLAIEPGGSLKIHASATTPVRGATRRLRHSDPHPAGPGVLDEPCAWGSTYFECTDLPPSTGSFATAQRWRSDGSAFTLSAWFMPTNLSGDTVLFSWDTASGPCVISLTSDATVAVVGDQKVVLSTAHFERTWHFVGVTFDANPGMNDPRLTLFSSPWGRTGGPYLTDPIRCDCTPSADSAIRIGSVSGLLTDGGQLDGLLTGLLIHSSALDVVDLMSVANGVGPEPLSNWEFSPGPDPDRVRSTTIGTDDLILTHAPTRSAVVPEPLSDGRPVTDARVSVHFHVDDVEDCGWPVAAQLDVPATAVPGFYSITLTSPDEEAFELPFIVRGSAPVTLLAPTLTWQAYANLGRARASWPGLSHYALHADGSPVVVTTSRKPTQTFAPSARLEVDATDGFASGQLLTHLLMADLYADHWLGQRGPHGVLDDRALNEPGSAALDGVTTLVFSAHPEYWTSQMLDTLEWFIQRGGNAIYLGGNGFYWVTSLHPTKPHLMEVRRFGGSQTCSVIDNDRRHQFEDCKGGLWRDNGRASGTIVGVEFAGFGAGDSLSYTRTAESRRVEWDWVFDGVDGDTFGAGGLNTGAGNELDWVPSNPVLDTTILASAQPSGREFFSAYEQTTVPNAAVRADIAISKTEAGGLILALGAISASGCLPINNGDNPISKICGNVLDRMLA